eukprot:1924846-Heterocapsa_arctica.AAC.1
MGSGASSSWAPACPPGPAPPPGPPPWGQPMFEGSVDRNPSPQGYGAHVRGTEFLGHAKAPPQRPPGPIPHPPQEPPEQPPWCNEHAFSSRNPNCYKCEHVRNWWRHELARGGN